MLFFIVFSSFHSQNIKRFPLLYTIAESPQAPPKAYKSGRELLPAAPLFRLLKEGKNSICARLPAVDNIAPGKARTNCRGGGLCLARAIPALSSAPCRASVTLSKYSPQAEGGREGGGLPPRAFPHFLQAFAVTRFAPPSIVSRHRNRRGGLARFRACVPH